MTLIRNKIARALRKYTDTQLLDFCEQMQLQSFYWGGFKGEYSWYNFGLYVQLGLTQRNINIYRKTQEEIEQIIFDTFTNKITEKT